MAKRRRVFLKLSGEALQDKTTGRYDLERVREVAREVREAVMEGVEIGMLATVMNCLYVSEVFREAGMKTAIFTPFEIGRITELFSKDAANDAFREGKVLFFAGGTGHPYFSTDTGITLRAVEMEADEILLAKSIDGVYDSDPSVNPDAKKFETISIHDVVEMKLGVIDRTAAVMCEDNHMALAVFDLREKNSIRDALRGEIRGTRVTAD